MRSAYSEWHERRRGVLGASEVAAVIGCSPHAKPLDVWAAKVLPYKPRREPLATLAGRLLEPGILALYAARTGRAVNPGHFAPGPEPWIGSTPDGFDPQPVQAKAVGRWMADAWGPDGDADGVPAHYIPQMQWELLCTRASHGHFMAGFDLTDWRIYRVERNDELIALLVDYCRDWWQRYVIPMDPQVMPDGRDAEVVRRAILALYPRNKTPLREATPDEQALALAYAARRADVKAAIEAKEDAGNLVRRAIGHGEGWMGSWGKATWKANSKSDRALYVRIAGENDDD